MLRRLSGLLLLFALSGCNGGVTKTETGVAALPAEVDMPVGFTHDVLLVSCRKQASLAGLLAPVVITAVFSVEGGRLDALLGLPGATIDAVLQGPQLGGCEPVDFDVRDVTLSVDGWDLEPTENPAAFRVRAASEGDATLEAHVDIDGEPFVARSTLRAREITRVTFEPLCDMSYQGKPPNVWVPAGGELQFFQDVRHDDIQLVGYGDAVVDLGDNLTAVAYDPAAVVDGVPSWNAAVVVVNIGAATGPITLTSSYDAAYERSLTVYDDAMIDGLRLERLKILRYSMERDVIEPDAIVQVLMMPTIGGEDVCRAAIHRRATIETPEVCEWSEATGATVDVTAESRSIQYVRAKAPGTCSIQVTIPGTALSAALDLDVIPASP